MNGYINPIKNHTIPSEKEVRKSLASSSPSVSFGFLVSKNLYFRKEDWNIIEEGISSIPIFSYGATINILTMTYKVK